MTGPISEAATGPREPAAAVPAKEGLPSGPGNPGAGLLVDEGPAGRDAGPRPAGRAPRPHRRNRRRSHARLANMTRKADGYDTRDRRKRHSIRHAWLPTVSHSHLLQRPSPSPHHSPGLPRQENSWTGCRRGDLEGIAAALRSPCRSGRERLSHRIPVNARAPELVAARRAVLGASGCPTAVSSGPTGCGMASAGSDRLVSEVLLWLVGRDSEQGVMLHVCSKAPQRRPFRMTWLKVGARRARRAVGGAWRDSATMCYSEPGADRSGGALPGPVALRALEVAPYRRSRGQGVREHHAPVGA